MCIHCESQVHIVCCLIPIDDDAYVDVAQALQISVTMICRFFDPEKTFETAVSIE